MIVLLFGFAMFALGWIAGDAGCPTSEFTWRKMVAFMAAVLTALLCGMILLGTR